MVSREAAETPWTEFVQKQSPVDAFLATLEIETSRCKPHIRPLLQKYVAWILMLMGKLDGAERSGFAFADLAHAAHLRPPCHKILQ